MAPTARNSVDQERGEPAALPQTSSPQSLSKAVLARRAEYVRPRKIKVKIGTWNVAACPGTEKDLAGWFTEGKGIDKRLSKISIGGSENPATVESIEAQEQRHSENWPTIPKGDEGAVPGGTDIGLYVLGLQEVVELSSAKEVIGRVYADPSPVVKWRNALTEALPPGYVSVAENQLSGLLLLIFASPDVAPTITSVSTSIVGTGIMGYLGNKGAVTTRIVLGETTRLVFINCHLAAGAETGNLDRRCWDVAQIMQRTQFEPIDWGGVLDDKQEGIGEEDFAFWFGDLNFRLDGLPGDDIRRLLSLHAREEHDITQEPWSKVDSVLENDDVIVIKAADSDDESELETLPRTSSAFGNNDDASSMTLPDPDDFIQDPSQDPTSLQAIIDSLLPHDQLRHVQKTSKALQDGWREGPITFLPTYKYDIGSVGIFDSSEKKRAPSWCDRILFRTRRDKLEYDGKFQVEELARIKDAQMKARGIDRAQDDEDVLFDYNPEEDGEEDGAGEAEVEEEPETAKDFFEEYDENEDAEEVVTKEGFVDKIHLDAYTTHQRVLSSDHKPLDALFTLEYDAAIPELKSRIQAEVARELDRAENEGRPGITVVVDRSLDVEQPRTEPQSRLTGGAHGVNFGPVSFYKRVRRSVTIANTSQVNSSFVFLERPGEPGQCERIAPPWLFVSFDGSDHDEDSRHAKGLKRDITLEPGDTINVTLELFIDDVRSIKSLNDGLTTLDDVLVLRVTDGRDHFIPIRGSWLQSCFGRSVDELIRIPEGGIGSLPSRDGLEQSIINSNLKVCWSAPRELFKLTEAVESLSTKCTADASTPENPQVPKDAPGWPFEKVFWRFRDSHSREVHKVRIIDALDWDKDLLDAFPTEVPAVEQIEILAEVLVMWLSSLTDGIVPGDLWTQLEDDMNVRGAKQMSEVEEIKTWVLDVLSSSPNHNISFVFLMSMVKRVAAVFAPLPKIGWKETVGLGGLDSVRRSLSWRGKGQYVLNEKEILRRQAQEKAYADVFSRIIFRGPVLTKEKEKRAVNDRRKYILEAFLHGNASPQ
jgi:hypothetical protein